MKARSPNKSKESSLLWSTLTISLTSTVHWSLYSSECLNFISHVFKPWYVPVSYKFRLSLGSRCVKAFLKAGWAITDHVGCTITSDFPSHQPALCQPAAAGPCCRHIRWETLYYPDTHEIAIHRAFILWILCFLMCCHVYVLFFLDTLSSFDSNSYLWLKLMVKTLFKRLYKGLYWLKKHIWFSLCG